MGVEGDQFHCMARTGLEKKSTGADGKHNNNRAVSIYKYGVLIRLKLNVIQKWEFLYSIMRVGCDRRTFLEQERKPTAVIVYSFLPFSCHFVARAKSSEHVDGTKILERYTSKPGGEACGSRPEMSYDYSRDFVKMAMFSAGT